MKMTTTNKLECVARLEQLGIERSDAYALRRIAMTLHRWHELECGDSNDYASWTIARGRKDEGGAFEYDETGDSYLERHVHSENGARYSRIPDRERGALKRLGKIMANYPTLTPYVQGDPRGASLYILPPGTSAEDYNRGVAVYK
jgi:hypothetical protein